MRISLIFEPTEEPCSLCGGTGPCFRTHVFLGLGSAVTDPRCGACSVTVERSVDLELHEPEHEKNHRQTFRRQKKRSAKQEHDVAEQLGAKVQLASGAMKSAKGDFRKKGEIRGEAKYTEANSYSLHTEDLDKIASECGTGERPVLVIDFVEKGTQSLKDRYAVIPFSDYKELLDASRKNR